jgi:hypothetical protein
MMMNFLLRVVLFLMGLVLAASLAVAVMLLAAVWGLRYGWARLTGQPVRPWVMRFEPLRSRPSQPPRMWGVRGHAARPPTARCACAIAAPT